MKTLIISLCFIILLFACDNPPVKNGNEEYQFTAEVLRHGLDCGSAWLVEIHADTSRIKAITGRPDSVYYADLLPDELKIQHLKIDLNFRKIKDSERYPCTCLDFAYEHIVVLKAAKSQGI